MNDNSYPNRSMPGKAGKQNVEPKPNMNVGEAAEYLGICPRKTRELIALGELRVVRIGRRVIIRMKDCDDFLESHVQ